MVDVQRPTWINSKIRSTELGDETQLLQYGIEDSVEFDRLEYDLPAPSSMKYWAPKEQADDFYYKIVSSYVTLTMDKDVI